MMSDLNLAARVESHNRTGSLLREAKALRKEGNELPPELEEKINQAVYAEYLLSEKTEKPVPWYLRWNEDKHGFSAERIRNCIQFQLEQKKDRWFSTISPSCLDSENYVVKLDRETPPDWHAPKPKMITVPDPACAKCRGAGGRVVQVGFGAHNIPCTCLHEIPYIPGAVR